MCSARSTLQTRGPTSPNYPAQSGAWYEAQRCRTTLAFVCLGWWRAPPEPDSLAKGDLAAAACISAKHIRPTPSGLRPFNAEIFRHFAQILVALGVPPVCALLLRCRLAAQKFSLTSRLRPSANGLDAGQIILNPPLASDPPPFAFASPINALPSPPKESPSPCSSMTSPCAALSHQPSSNHFPGQ